MIAKFLLSDRHRRPVFGFQTAGNHYTALLDTGAEIPVFTHGAKNLKSIGGVFKEKGETFTGFGGECVGDLYCVDLTIGVLRYADMPVICLNDLPMEFEFILPATLFSGFRYTIDDNAKILTVDTLGTATEYRVKLVAGGRGVMLTFEERPEQQRALI